MIVLSWNIRGLGARVKRSSLRKIIHIHDPSFIAIQESKLETCSSKLIRSFWRLDNIDWALCPSQGNSGGIISLWSKSFFSMSSTLSSRHWLATQGVILSCQLECIIINIYNPCSVEARAVVWSEIAEFEKEKNIPLLLLGDFNEVLSPNDRGSLLSSQSGMQDFHSFVQQLQLTEIPSSGKYTWFRGNSKSKLDRVFVNPEWIIHFPKLILSLLNRGISDHCPLLLKTHAKKLGTKALQVPKLLAFGSQMYEIDIRNMAEEWCSPN